MQVLPKKLERLRRTSELIKQPMFRFLERETAIGSDLLAMLRRDLDQIKQMSEGKTKPISFLKDLARQLYLGKVPKKWRVFQSINKDVGIWVQDVKSRIDQLAEIARQSQ